LNVCIQPQIVELVPQICPNISISILTALIIARLAGLENSGRGEPWLQLEVQVEVEVSFNVEPLNAIYNNIRAPYSYNLPVERTKW